MDITDAPLRVRVRIGGEVQGLQVVPRAGSPSLEVTISDGTGRAVAVFTGRKKLPGVDPGRRVVLEGRRPGRAGPDAADQPGLHAADLTIAQIDG